MIINLSSNEYSSLLNLNNKNIYTVDFKVLDDGILKANSMELKKMRGKFANYIINNNINNINLLKNINIDGYKYNEKYSKENKLIFIKEKDSPNI